MLAIQPLTNKKLNPFPINWTAQTKYLTFFKNISNKYGFIRGGSGPDLIFLCPFIPGPPHIRTNIRNSQNAPPISRQFILNIFFDQFYNANAGSDTANIDVMKESPLCLVSHRRGQPSHVKSSHVQPIDRLQKHFHNALKRFSIIHKGMSHALPPLQKKSRHGELDPAMTPQPAVDYPVSFDQQSSLRNAGPTHIECSPSWTSCSSWFNPHIYHKKHEVHEENSVLSRLKRIPNPCVLSLLQNAINQLSTSPHHVFQRISSHYLRPLQKRLIHRLLGTFMTKGSYGIKDEAGTMELTNLYPVSLNQQSYLQNAVQTLSILPRHVRQRVSQPLRKRRRHGEKDPAITPKQAVNYPVFHSQQSYPQNAIQQLSIVSPHILPRFLSHYFHPLSKKWIHRSLDTFVTRGIYGTKDKAGTTELDNLHPVSPMQQNFFQNIIQKFSILPRHVFKRVGLHYLRSLQKRLINRSFDIFGTRGGHGTKCEAGTTELASLYPVSFDQQSYLQNAIQTLSILPRHVRQRVSQPLRKRRRHGEKDPAMTPKQAVNYSVFHSKQSYPQNAIQQLSIVSPHIPPRFLSHYFHPLSKKWIHRSLDTSTIRKIYGTTNEAGTTELDNLHRQQNFFQNTIQTLLILPRHLLQRVSQPLRKRRRHGEQDPVMTPQPAVDHPVFHSQQPYPQNAINQLSILPRQVFQRVSSHYLWFLQKGRNKKRHNAAMIPDLAAHFSGAGGQQEYLSAAQKNRIASYPQMMLPGKTNSLLPYHSNTAEGQASQEKTEQKIRIFYDATAPLEDIVYKQNTNIDQLVKQSIKTEQIENKNHDNLMQPKYPGQEYPPAQSDAAMRGLSHRETKKLAGQVYQLIAKQVAFEKRRRGLS